MTIITIYQTFPIANVFPLFSFFDLSKHTKTSWLLRHWIVLDAIILFDLKLCNAFYF